MRVIVARSNSFIPSKCKNTTHCPESVLRSWIRVALPLRLGAFIRHFVLRKWRNEVPPMRRGGKQSFHGGGGVVLHDSANALKAKSFFTEHDSQGWESADLFSLPFSLGHFSRPFLLDAWPFRMIFTRARGVSPLTIHGRTVADFSVFPCICYAEMLFFHGLLA
ncbi:MAG: hypothetical protein Udaeo2_25870 [Candidatus Udaeobacter sp.]|nr:MAG: hypothetical protein Udaeo2_25870 [Candidatus Udaeobacter sp.]